MDGSPGEAPAGAAAQVTLHAGMEWWRGVEGCMEGSWDGGVKASQGSEMEGWRDGGVVGWRLCRAIGDKGIHKRERRNTGSRVLTLLGTCWLLLIHEKMKDFRFWYR